MIGQILLLPVPRTPEVSFLLEDSVAKRQGMTRTCLSGHGTHELPPEARRGGKGMKQNGMSRGMKTKERVDNPTGQRNDGDFR